MLALASKSRVMGRGGELWGGGITLTYLFRFPAHPGPMRNDHKLAHTNREGNYLACLRRVHDITQPILLDDGLGLRDNERDHDSPAEGDDVAHLDGADYG